MTYLLLFAAWGLLGCSAPPAQKIADTSHAACVRFAQLPGVSVVFSTGFYFHRWAQVDSLGIERVETHMARNPWPAGVARP